MSTQFTPGPWAVYPGNYRAAFVVPALDLPKKLGGADDIHEDLSTYAQDICAIEDHHRHRSVEEQRANACLIAAAPELLEALVELLKHNTPGDKERAVLVIKKATGSAA